MKKIISVFISILFILFSFAGCADSNPQTNVSDPVDESLVENESGIVFNNATDNSPSVYAVVSNDSPAVGEEVTIDIRLANAPMFCSVDLILSFNANALSVKHIGNCTIPNIMDNLNSENGTIVYSGMVMRSENVTDESLFKINVTPKDNSSGLQNITIDKQSLLLALDIDGNETVDRTNDLKTTDILLSVG